MLSATVLHCILALIIFKDSGSAVKNQHVHNKPREIVSPFAQDPDEPEKIAVWGDLAEIDNEASSDTESLWASWAEMVKPYLQMGFKGFQCYAAYKIPAELWHYLVEEAWTVDAEAII